MAKKIIIGLVGEIASGKDTVADHLARKYKAKTISFSQPLRTILEILYQPVSRINLSDLGHNLRDQFGQDLLSQVVAKQVAESKAKVIVLPNVRLESDIVYLKNMPGFVLVAISAEDRIRYERTIPREQYVGDSKKTFAQFKKDANLYTERGIRALMKKCKYKLENNGGKRELSKQVDELMEKLNKK